MTDLLSEDCCLVYYKTDFVNVSSAWRLEAKYLKCLQIMESITATFQVKTDDFLN